MLIHDDWMICGAHLNDLARWVCPRKGYTMLYLYLHGRLCVCVYVTKGYFDTKKQCDVFKYILLQNRSHWIPIKCLVHRPISGSKPLQPAVSSECSRATDDPWPWWSDRCCSLEPSLHWIRVQRDSTDLGVCPCLGYGSMGENPDAPLKIKLAS